MELSQWSFLKTDINSMGLHDILDNVMKYMVMLIYCNNTMTQLSKQERGLWIMSWRNANCTKCKKYNQYRIKKQRIAKRDFKVRDEK